MTTQHKFTIAVIGAGPAGLYAAQTLASSGHQVIMLNRDVKPGGLAEYGIFHNKEKMKGGLRNQFRNILENENIHYFGNVLLGNTADISLDDLRKIGVDAILVTVGAQGQVEPRCLAIDEFVRHVVQQYPVRMALGRPCCTCRQ